MLEFIVVKPVETKLELQKVISFRLKITTSMRPVWGP